MKRKIIQIDKDKCNGCGACAKACHEGAIAMIDGKATLLRDDYCDGLGDCLPVCPTDAISFVEREASEYNADAVAQNKAKSNSPLVCGCPGTMAKTISHSPTNYKEHSDSTLSKPVSRLSQWPIQIKLVNSKAAYFENAKLLVAADCTAYAYAGFHEDFINGRIAIIGCPKLDAVEYSEKLTEIIKNNNIKNVTVVRMEVPCCKGINDAVKTAIFNSGKMIPWQEVTISTDGQIIE